MNTNDVLSKLRAEIERHLERAIAEQEKFPDMPKYRWYLREGKKELCNDLLDYMYDTLGVEEPITDSLQQEQPCDTCTNDKGCVTCKDGELWEGKEQPSEELEEAARLYAIPHYMKDIDVNHIEEYPYDSGLEAAFIAGAEWQKEQMLKEAKDGYVSAIIIHNDGDEEHYAVTYPNGERPHSITDKVKIIIL